jgi:hypothetical protein
MLKAVMLAAMLPVAAAVGVARGDAPVLRPQSGTTPMTAPQTAGECTTYSVFRDGVRDGVWRMVSRADPCIQRDAACSVAPPSLALSHACVWLTRRTTRRSCTKTSCVFTARRTGSI